MKLREAEQMELDEISEVDGKEIEELKAWDRKWGGIR